jgi:LPXTG-site transpeptidase (sortase) family protein
MDQAYKRFLNLRRFNDVLSIVIIALAIYIFIWPFLPSLKWWTKFQAPIISHVPSVSVAASDPIPKENTLTIPTLEMREQVYDGTNLGTLSKGIWHLPNSSSPDKGGNTVMAGHRFTYSGKAVFYYLDKVKVNDNMTLYWQGKRYDYVVTAINVVPPTDGKLVAQTDNPTLTIYTCTPVWSAKDRLVITAKLAEIQ